jgi:hypothetical protein
VLTLRTVEDVAPLLGLSKRALHELTRLGRIPHRVLPHTRRCLFQDDWLEAWANGCELERVDLPGKGRIVRPKGADS